LHNQTRYIVQSSTEGTKSGYKSEKTKSYTNTIEPSDKTVQTCRPWNATKSLATHQLQYTDTQHYIQHT